MSEAENVNGGGLVSQNVGRCKFLLFSAFPEDNEIQKINIEHAKQLVDDKLPRGVYQKEDDGGREYIKWYILGKYSVLTRKVMCEYKQAHWRTMTESAIFAPTSVARHVGTALYEDGFIFKRS